MPESSAFTFQTRIKSSAGSVLDAYASHYQWLMRKLYARIQAGGTIDELKREFIAEYRISARQFNAMRIELEGKLESIRKVTALNLAETKERIKSIKSWIKKAEKQVSKPDLDQTQVEKKKFALHQKKRRLNILESRQLRLESGIKSGITRICFGSRKLFRTQFQLDKNDYSSHQEWNQDWKEVRSNQFFVLGSKDESAGCQGCQAMPQADGSFTLKLRLPDALDNGKTVLIPDVRFAYGHDKIMTALASGCRIEQLSGAFYDSIL